MRKNQLLENILARQLAKQNFVVVPGFGAFICKEIPAQISSNGFILTPPAKEVVFNPKVLASDGLLEQELVVNHDFNYSSADEFVKSKVESWNNDLREKGQITIPKIGVFFKAPSNKISFKPFKYANFLPSSFGLEIAKAQPLELAKQPKGQEVIQEPETKTIVIEKIPVSYQRFKKIAVVAIFILSVSATYLYMLSFNPKAVDRAGLNFFDVPIIEEEDLERLEKAKEGQELVEKSIKETTKDAEKIIAQKEDELSESETLEENLIDETEESETPEAEIIEPNNEVIEEEPVVENQKDEVTAQSIKKGFYLIASSVTNKSQVEPEIKRFKLKGFEPKVLEMEGKFRISIGYFATRDSANTFKQNIYNDNNIETWLHAQ
jgi:nucleoid DNA-binding protein